MEFLPIPFVWLASTRSARYEANQYQPWDAPRTARLEGLSDLLGCQGHRLRAFSRFLESELRRLACLVRVVASHNCLLLARFVCAFVALFRSGPVTLGGSFVVVSG
jgi:hypothetical protein